MSNFQTRGGQPYREAGINRDASYYHQRVGWYQAVDGAWYATSHSLDGQVGSWGEDPLDLVPAPEESAT